MEKITSEIKGLIGLLLATVMPFMHEINSLIQLLGALLGLVLLVISIRNKAQERRKNEIEIKLLEKEYEDNSKKN